MKAEDVYGDSGRGDFQYLIQRFSQGRTECNCGDAYYTRGDTTWTLDGWRTIERDSCYGGCATNQIKAKEYVALRAIQRLAELGDEGAAAYLAQRRP